MEFGSAPLCHTRAFPGGALGSGAKQRLITVRRSVADQSGKGKRNAVSWGNEQTLKTLSPHLLPSAVAASLLLFPCQGALSCTLTSPLSLMHVQTWLICIFHLPGHTGLGKATGLIPSNERLP